MDSSESPEEGRPKLTKLQAIYYERYPKLFEIKDTPAISPKAMLKILHRLHEDNPNYEIIKTFLDHGGFGIKSFSDNAESTFVQAIYEVITTPPGELRKLEMADLQEVRSQLADYYMENLEQGRIHRPAEGAREINTEAQREGILALLQGTFSATIFNALKSQGIIPEDVIAGDLYERKTDAKGLER